MNDKFTPTNIQQLYLLIQNERKQRNTIFGIPQSLFFTPNLQQPFRFLRYNIEMENPIGVAAGPHTQLAQNIITAWLCGARYFELKTIQTLDELEITKPCIHVNKAGFNCEWSQELNLEQSFDQYLNAWILIHVLKNQLFPDLDSTNPGFIFNMSVGYNMEGILKDNVQSFLNNMDNASSFIANKIEILASLIPNIHDIDIPSRISDNVTLSTMHGCPPKEIEQIGTYLIKKRKLHTTIKLNPTLLGPDKLRGLLNKNFDYDIRVLDEAFEHDLKYQDATGIITRLSQAAQESGVDFSVKLTNTLENSNFRHLFSESESMIYMSGTPLHPLGVELAYRLQKEFDGSLDISFSGGADCFNISPLLSCGIAPVTVCTDILKPGGYGRLRQYLENLEIEFNNHQSKTPEKFVLNTSGETDLADARLKNLATYRESLLQTPKLKNNPYHSVNIKTSRDLPELDCVSAPCAETCPDRQDVPGYMRYSALGEWDNAYALIRDTNPFPHVTGTVCDHPCTGKCTRLNYDAVLNIPGIKLAASLYQNGKYKIKKLVFNGKKVALIGAGPSSLSCAYYLALAGFHTDVFEAKSIPGGMVTDAIPLFRLDRKRFEKDLEYIIEAGVNIHYDQQIDAKYFKRLKQEYDHIYIGIGAQSAKKMNVPGEDCEGCIDALSFLSKYNHDEQPDIGQSIAVVGGGNSAMDAARTAKRLVGDNGAVTLIYRRTRAQMPASQEEIEDTIREGVIVRELTQPVGINQINDKIQIRCIHMELGEPDESGRRRPMPVEGSEFTMELDTIISAIGQNIELNFIDIADTEKTNIHIGGDAMHGPANIITAIADGRHTAEIIAQSYNINTLNLEIERPAMSLAEQQKRASTRIYPLSDLHSPYTKEQAIAEAERCLDCDSICNVCVSVCPNRANIFATSEPLHYKLAEIRINGDSVQIDYTGNFHIRQPYQTFNIADWCNHCGNCETFCPTSGAPYKTNPRICLSQESFSLEDNAYLMASHEGKFTVVSKQNGDFIEKLWYDQDGFIYQNDVFSAKFDPRTLEIKILTLAQNSDYKTVVDTENIAKMAVIYKSLKFRFFPEEK